MSTAQPLALLDARQTEGVRIRPLPRGRAWHLFDGATLTARPDLARELSDALRPVAEDAFACAGPQFLDLVAGPERLASRTTVAVLRGADGDVGGMVSHVAGEWGGERCFYAASAFVRPAERGTGVVASGYGMLMRAELMRSPMRPMYAVVRTPNPVVYAAWRHGGRKMGGVVEPSVDLQVSETTRRVALAAADANGFLDRVDPRTLVVRGAYEGGVVPGGEGPYGVRPRSGDPKLDALFAQLLGPEDALLAVARISLHRAAALAGDRAIRQRLGRIGGRRRGALVTPPVIAHTRVHATERRTVDRRRVERRGADRRRIERRQAGSVRNDRRGDGAWDGVERRTLQRRAAQRREPLTERRSAAHRRADGPPRSPHRA
jgi:putative intracellular protease/amidase